MDVHHLPQLWPKMALQWMRNVVCWFYNENSLPFVSFSLLRNAWNWIHVDLWVAKKFEWSFRFRKCRWRRRMFSYCMVKHDVKSIHSIRFSFNFPFSRTTAKAKLSDIVKAHYCWRIHLAPIGREKSLFWAMRRRRLNLNWSAASCSRYRNVWGA